MAIPPIIAQIEIIAPTNKDPSSGIPVYSSMKIEKETIKAPNIINGEKNFLKKSNINLK
jgi:hypothetical protein